MELLGTEVVGENVKRKNVPDSVNGELLGENRRHGGIVEGEDGDGLAAVDFRC